MKRGDKVFIVCLLVACVLILGYERLNHEVEKTLNVPSPASVHHIPWETRSGASNTRRVSVKNGNNISKNVDTTKNVDTLKNGNNAIRNVNNRTLTSQDIRQAPETKRVFSTPLGRLGNLLFNLASGYGIARTNGRRFVLTRQFVKSIQRFLNTTELPFEVSPPPKNLTDKTVKFGIYDKSMEHLPDKDIRVGYYLQAWQYFMPYESSLRALLRINSDLVSKAQGFLTSLGPEELEHRTFIGVHIRQGDYVETNAVNEGRLTPGPAYMRKAMGHYLKMYPNVTFIVCSDSIAWCKQNMDSLRPNKSDANYELHFSNFRSAEQDLALLAQCNHTIMTVGTYGWWAGWLAGGNVIYFKHPFRPGSGYDSRFRDSDHFLPRWIGMDDMESNTTDSSLRPMQDGQR